MHLPNNSIALLESSNVWSDFIDFSRDVAVKYERPVRHEEAGLLHSA